MRTIFNFFLLLFITVLFFSISPTFGENIVVEEVQHSLKKNPESVTLLFVGDIMLGRVVENIIERTSFQYPFEYVVSLLRDADATIGNFEGVVNTMHKKTLPYGFQFSIKEDYLTGLADIGFDTLSLANNHANDFGASALSYTRETCEEAGLFCIGDPNTLNEYSTGLQQVGKYTIGYLFLHTLVSSPSLEDLSHEVEKLKKQSDLVFAYVHWGTEYELVHNKVQQSLAHSLIDAGVDAVIGHHPHVVQDVELYKERPVFYSLGNFIFDQYFSADVQQGIGVNVLINDQDVTYTIIGFTSEESANQPRLMAADASTLLLARIMKNVSHTNGAFDLSLLDN